MMIENYYTPLTNLLKKLNFQYGEYSHIKGSFHFSLKTPQYDYLFSFNGLINRIDYYIISHNEYCASNETITISQGIDIICKSFKIELRKLKIESLLTSID